MTNPGNAIGTNGAFNGRTSPNALNDIAGAFTRGIASGWNCRPKSGMTVQLGGDASTRDVALAEDNAGNKLTINNRSGAPVEVTLAGAPATNNRIDAIVAYVDNPSTGDGGTTDNPVTCGIIAVSGTVAASPVPPTEAQIRAAITADGATGGVAYFATLATILVGTNVTTIGAGVITQGTPTKTQNIEIADGTITTAKVANQAITSAKIDWATTPESYSTSEINTGATWYNGKTIYKKTIHFGALPNNTAKEVAHGISNMAECIKYDGIAYLGTNQSWWTLPLVMRGTETAFQTVCYITNNVIYMANQADRSPFDAYITIWYTKK